MDYTTNYHLPQWVESDRIMMEDFNEAMAAIDGGIKAVDDTVTQGLAEVAANLGSGGKTTRIAWGSYVGTNQCGVDHPNTLSFAFQPVLVYIQGISKSGTSHDTLMFLRPAERTGPFNNPAQIPVSWSDQGLSWYAPDTVTGDQVNAQMNSIGYTYYYVAVGAATES